MKCPTEENLIQYLDDVLGEEERSRVVKHLRDCEKCKTMLQRLSDEDEGLIECFRDSFAAPISVNEEKRIVAWLLGLGKRRQSERRRKMRSGRKHSEGSAQ